MNKNVTKQGTLLKREKICMIFIWDIFIIDPRAQIVVPLSPKYNVTCMEPITRSELLPCWAYVTAFLPTSLFLNAIQGIFSRENRISTMSRSIYERIGSIRYQKGKLDVIKRQKNIIFRSVGFAEQFVEFKRYSKFAPKLF